MKNTPAFIAQLREAYTQAYAAYEQAIISRGQADRLLDLVPLDDTTLYQRVQAMQERCVTVINKAWDAKNALDKLMNEGE